MTNLHKKKCIACSGDMPSLKEEEIQKLNSELNQWIVVKNQDGIKTLTKYLKFKNFEESLNFINKLSAIAEEEGHHPDLSFGWGYANVNPKTPKPLERDTQIDFCYINGRLIQLNFYF